METTEIKKALRATTSKERYNYFLEVIVDQEKFFSRIDTEGNWNLVGVDNHVLFPMWPTAQTAELVNTGLYEDSIVVELTFEDLEEIFEETYKGQEYLFNIMPIDGEHSGFVVSSEELFRDMGHVAEYGDLGDHPFKKPI